MLAKSRRILRSRVRQMPVPENDWTSGRLDFFPARSLLFWLSVRSSAHSFANKESKALGGASFLPEHTPDKNPIARGSLASLVNLSTCGELPSLVAGQKWQQGPKIIKNPSIASFIAWGRGVKIGDYRGNVLKNNGFWALFTRQLLINWRWVSPKAIWENRSWCRKNCYLWELRPNYPEL